MRQKTQHIAYCISITTPYIKSGKVLFPRYGAIELISQITNFGIEKHEDLADGFSTLIIKTIESDRPYYKFEERGLVPDLPIYVDFGDQRIDMSKPLFTMDMKF